MTPHRLLYMTEATVFGGAERYMLLLLERLNRTHFAPAVACHPNAPSELTHALAKLHVPILPVAPINGKADLKGLFNQYYFFRKQHPSIVHFNLANPLHGQFSMLSARWAKVPIQIATMHLPPRETTPTWRGRFLEKQTLGGLDCLIAVCQSSKNLIMNHFALPDHQVSVIYNGLNPAIYTNQVSTPTRETLGLPWPDGPIVGMVGRLTEQKGCDILLKAIPDVLQIMPNVRFVIVGDGPLRQNLETQTQHLGITHAVYFTGLRPDVPHLLNTFQLFVLPSRYESFPFSILEAMASTLPVIVTDVDGVSEAVAHEENGLVIPKENVEMLKEAIISLLKNPEKARIMGEKNQRRVVENFTLAHMVSNTEAIYDRCLQINKHH